MISVVIPTYNVESYIETCLNSVLSQHEVELEIIIVDDGSTDSTFNIVNKFATLHSNIFVVSQANAGPSAARNAALKYCHGEWITMVDGDDILAPDALKKMLNIATSYDNIDLVIGKYKSFDQHLNISSKDNSTRPIFLSGGDAAEIMLYQNKFTDSVIPSSWGKLYHHSVWENATYTEGVIYEDLHILPRIINSTSRIAVINDVVYGYRRNPDSLLHTFSPRRFDALKATTELCNYFSYDKDLYKAAQSRRFSAAFNLWLLTMVNNANLPQQLAQCKAIVRSLAGSQIFGRKVRFKNRIGAILQYFPFIFQSSRFCKLFLAK